MILIKQIHLSNFLSHKDTQVTVPDDKKILIDGQSGAGKSAIIEGIIWGIYGKGRISNKGLIRNGCKKAGVQLDLIDVESKTIYRIERSINHRGRHSVTLLIQKEGGTFEPAPTTQIKEVQEYIETKVVGASYQLFINSVAYPQGTPDSFVTATSKKRKDILLEIVGANEMYGLYKKAAAKLQTKNLEYSEIAGKKQSTLEAIKLLEENLVSTGQLQDELLELEKEHKETAEKLSTVRDDVYLLRSKQQELKQLKAEHADVSSSDLEALKSELLSIERKLQGSDRAVVEKALEDISKQVEDTWKTTSELNAHLVEKPAEKDFDNQIDFYTKKLAEMEKHSPVCPSGDDCPYMKQRAPERASIQASIESAKQDKKNFALQSKEWAEKYSELKEADDSAKQRRETLISQKNETSTRLSEIKSFERLKNELQAKIASKEDADKALEQIGALGANVKAIKERLVTTIGENIEEEFEQLNAAEKQLVEQIHRKKSHIEEVGKAVQKIETLKETIKQLDKDNADLYKEIEVLSLAKEAFGTNGITAVTVDYILPELEDRINDVLSQLSEFKIKLSTQRGNTNDSVTEGLFITVVDPHNNEMEYESYSGGEKLKISVAICEALASLQKAGFRLVDELFIGLDEDSTESFAEVLTKIQEHFPQMLCISHLRSIKDLFDESINIIKINGTSSIDN